MTRLILALCLWATATAAHDTFYVYEAEIVRIYDGDTPTVDIDVGFEIWLRDQDLRLYCINTPEVRGEEREQGLMVRDLVREWLPPGSTVRLETIQDRTGKFGRWLSIITPEGWTESLNQRLYREGHAKIEAYTNRQRAECAEMMANAD